MELKKILCAVDLKDSVNPAVEYAKMLSELSGASISAIYVVSSRSAYENLQVPVEDIAKGMRSIWSRARGIWMPSWRSSSPAWTSTAHL